MEGEQCLCNHSKGQASGNRSRFPYPLNTQQTFPLSAHQFSLYSKMAASFFSLCKKVRFFCLSKVLGNYGGRLNFPYLAQEGVYLKTQDPVLFLSLQSIWPHI